MRKRLLRLFLGLLLIQVILIARFITKGPVTEKHIPEGNGYYRVADVHDGDTVSVDMDGRIEKIRLVGIDAPETGQKPWGQKAKRHLEEILSETDWNISLEYDIGKKDRYGRQLAYLWTKDKKMLNLKMVEHGYAMLLTIPPNVKHVDELTQAQRQAHENKLGIWGENGLKEKPADYRKRHRR